MYSTSREFQVDGAETVKVNEEKLLVIPAYVAGTFIAVICSVIVPELFTLFSVSATPLLYFLSGKPL